MNWCLWQNLLSKIIEKAAHAGSQHVGLDSIEVMFLFSLNYIYIYIHMCVHIYICIYICVYIYLYICEYICVYVYTVYIVLVSSILLYQVPEGLLLFFYFLLHHNLSWWCANMKKALKWNKMCFVFFSFQHKNKILQCCLFCGLCETNVALLI